MQCASSSVVGIGHFTNAVIRRRTATLGLLLYWWGGYALYSAFHLVCLPYVLIRFLHRLRDGRYRGVIGTRFLGGTTPPRRDRWTLVIASGLGETRTAVQAADEIATKLGVPVAALTQLPRMPGALKSGDSTFPIGFAPFNSPISALIALARWRPKTILFVEFSGNYHLAFWARMLGVRTALINVNLPENRLRRLQRKWLGRWQFSFVDGFCVQARTHAERLERLGIEPERIVITGIAIGPLQGAGSAPEEVRRKWHSLLQIQEGTPVLVAGSTYADEERILLDAVAKVREDVSNLVFVLAPRKLKREEPAETILQEAGEDFEKRSLLDRHDRVSNTILLDSVGELREVYSISTVAFVGGTLVTDIGGHTPLEPLSWGIPITVGPHFGQQEAAVCLCESSGILKICTGVESLAHAWQIAIQDPNGKAEAQAIADQVARTPQTVFVDAYRAAQGVPGAS